MLIIVSFHPLFFLYTDNNIESFQSPAFSMKYCLCTYLFWPPYFQSINKSIIALCTYCMMPYLYCIQKHPHTCQPLGVKNQIMTCIGPKKADNYSWRTLSAIFQNKDNIWLFNVINNNHTCCKNAWKMF